MIKKPIEESKTGTTKPSSSYIERNINTDNRINQVLGSENYDIEEIKETLQHNMKMISLEIYRQIGKKVIQNAFPSFAAGFFYNKEFKLNSDGRYGVWSTDETKAKLPPLPQHVIT